MTSKDTMENSAVAKESPKAVENSKAIKNNPITASSSENTASEYGSKSTTGNKSATSAQKQTPINDTDITKSLHNVEGRETWTNHLDFILSCLGFAVGLGNVWRYPYLAFKNGGAAFIIPYIISVLLAGMPLYGIEAFLGQLSGLGASEALGCLAPVFQGVGWAMISMSYMVSLYYNMVIAWSLYYLVNTFRSVLPFSNCDNEWNTNDCYSKVDDDSCKKNFSEAYVWFNHSCTNDTENLTRVSSSDEYFYRHVLNFSPDETLGSLNSDMALCLLGAWVLVFLCIAGGVKFSGKIVYFTALFPYVMLIILLVYGATMPGAGEGIKFYLLPNFTKLTEFQVWKDASIQVFFSLNPAMGGIVTMASYNKFHNNLARDAFLICILDSLTSILAGCSVFASVGYLAAELNTTVEDATQSHLGLVFIVFPETITRMPGSHVWSFLFFLMLITLGLDSQFVLYETAVTAITDRFPYMRQPKQRLFLVAFGCIVSYLIGLLFCTQAGIYIFLLFDDHSAGYCTLIVGFLESVLIAYIYGVNNFIDDIALAIGYKLGWYWKLVWLITCPFYMLMIFICLLYFYGPSEFRGVPMSETAQAAGWGISVIAALILLVFPIYQIVQNRIKHEPWIKLVTPTKNWNPKKRHELALAAEAEAEAKKTAEAEAEAKKSTNKKTV